MLVSKLRFILLALLFVFAASPALSEPIKNAAYRFMLDKPNGWLDVSARELAKFAKPVGNESAAGIAQSAQALVVGFAKHKEPYDDVNSTFSMLGLKVGAAAQSVPPARFADMVMANAAKSGAKLAIVSPTKTTTVGGLPAAHVRFHTDSMLEQRLYKSETDMWVVPRGEAILVIQIQAKRGDKAAGMGQLRAAVKSIRFER